jgi:hypothetical protein
LTKVLFSAILIRQNQKMTNHNSWEEIYEEITSCPFIHDDRDQPGERSASSVFRSNSGARGD